MLLHLESAFVLDPSIRLPEENTARMPAYACLLVLLILCVAATASPQSPVFPFQEREKRQILTDFIHVHNPNPAANSFDWVATTSQIHTPSLPFAPSPPPTPFLAQSIGG